MTLSGSGRAETHKNRNSPRCSLADTFKCMALCGGEGWERRTFLAVRACDSEEEVAQGEHANGGVTGDTLPNLTPCSAGGQVAWPGV